MNQPAPYALPWASVPLWQAAHDILARTLAQHQETLQPAIVMALRIRERIAAMDGPLSQLRSQTCSQCRSICCRHAHAYYDFKDLIFLHLGHVTLPAHQTFENPRQTCRYLAADGCGLPRLQRPFICTWYLCAAQKARLAQGAVSMRQFVLNSLEAIKSGRKQMETAYVQATAGGSGI